jgi:hypothetical protein
MTPLDQGANGSAMRANRRDERKPLFGMYVRLGSWGIGKIFFAVKYTNLREYQR